MNWYMQMLRDGEGHPGDVSLVNICVHFSCERELLGQLVSVSRCARESSPNAPVAIDPSPAGCGGPLCHCSSAWRSPGTICKSSSQMNSGISLWRHFMFPCRQVDLGIFVCFITHISCLVTLFWVTMGITLSVMSPNSSEPSARGWWADLQPGAGEREAWLWTGEVSTYYH